MKWSSWLACSMFAVAMAVWTTAGLCQGAERARWAREAAAVTIVRDDWGIAHVHGKTDADAVFGMVYAQCEDDFNRVETNYLVSLGRLAEAEGETAVWQDLRQRLFLDPEELKRQYAGAPVWLRTLMDAWADGLNFYLFKHPEVKPRAIARFEPWMALSFTEGSIGGDIEKVNLQALRGFYEKPRASGLVVGAGAGANADPPPSAKDDKVRGSGGLRTPGEWAGANTGILRSAQDDTFIAEASLEHGMMLQSYLHPDGEELGGSNGFAIAPSNTVGHHALLLINPHTSFFFRSELQMSSDEGLNAYGAVTWGQMFVYQGFNDRAGWMHTSSNVDAVDEYEETTVAKGNGAFTYKYGKGERPFTTRRITLRYKTAEGMKERSFAAYFTHHGPVVRDDGGKWVTVRLMNVPVPALEQSFLRTKARSYAEYKKTMELKANSSNNTIFADADGDIAYWHGNFIPKRDADLDFTKPVDGSDPATEWGPLMSLEEIPHLLNPKSGYVENVNNWPWSGSGESSLKRADFPRYVEQGMETARGLHAVRVLDGRKDFTLDTLLGAGFDPYLPWFARTVPALVRAWDALPAASSLKPRLAEQVAMLRSWDKCWAADSYATTIAVYWGEQVGMPLAGPARRAGVLWEDYVVQHASYEDMLQALVRATDKLRSDFGNWKVAWGEVNRFQRIKDDIQPSFTDEGPSIAVPFVSSQWGSLASFAARTFPDATNGEQTKRRYGTSGNSFVAVVEFGDKVRARAVTAGGESGHPESKHFKDEAERYASGDFREVYFYPAQLVGHVERKYRPGD